jgi:hypothetical protein
MRSAEPRVINQIQLYRPPCQVCGGLTSLTRIEPCGEPNHDMRTFECDTCGTGEVVMIKFR